MASKSSFFSDTGGTAATGPASVTIPAPSSSNEGQFLRTSLGGTAYELQTVAQVQTDLGLPSPAAAYATEYLRVNAAGNMYEVRTTAQMQTDLGLPNPAAGIAGEYIRVNAAGNAFEGRTSSQARSDIGLGNVAVENIGIGLADDGASNLLALLHGQCQLQFISATSLKLVPYNGQFIRIAGKVYAIPFAGITISNAGLSASTSYYVYLYNNAGTLTLEFSTTGHVTDPSAGNIGVEVKSSDSTRTLVGMVRTDASSQFRDSATNRYVASWFNRRIRSLQGSGTGGASTASTSWVEINSASRVDFVVWADDQGWAECSGLVYNNTGSDISYMNIMVDGSVAGTTVSEQTTIVNASNGTASSVGLQVGEGYHWVTPAGEVNGGTGGYQVSIMGWLRA